MKFVFPKINKLQGINKKWKEIKMSISLLWTIKEIERKRKVVVLYPITVLYGITLTRMKRIKF